MMWAQFPNPKPQSRPRSIEFNGSRVLNPSDSELTEAGWYPVEYADLIQYQEYGDPALESGVIKYPAQDWAAERLAEAKTAHRQTLAAARYAAETGGMLWTQPSTRTDYGIATDDRSQSKIGGAFSLAKDDPLYTVPYWKCADLAGEVVFIPLTNADILDLGAMLGAFVAALFGAEEAKNAAVTSAADYAALRAVLWE